MLLAVLASLAALSHGTTRRAWHFTDVHFDPIYVVNSSVFSYCNGAVTNDSNKQAGKFGNSTGGVTSLLSRKVAYCMSSACAGTGG